MSLYGARNWRPSAGDYTWNNIDIIYCIYYKIAPPNLIFINGRFIAELGREWSWLQTVRYPGLKVQPIQIQSEKSIFDNGISQNQGWYVAIGIYISKLKHNLRIILRSSNKARTNAMASNPEPGACSPQNMGQTILSLRCRAILCFCVTLLLTPAKDKFNRSPSHLQRHR